MKKLIIIVGILFTMVFGVVPESLHGTWKMYKQEGGEYITLTIKKDSTTMLGNTLNFVKTIKDGDSIFVGITELSTVQVYMVDSDGNLCLYLISDIAYGKYYLKLYR